MDDYVMGKFEGSGIKSVYRKSAIENRAMVVENEI